MVKDLCAPTAESRVHSWKQKKQNKKKVNLLKVMQKLSTVLQRLKLGTIKNTKYNAMEITQTAFCSDLRTAVSGQTALTVD